MEFDQGGAPLTELAIVLSQAADAVHLLGRQRAQLRLATVAPGKHRGSVAGAIRGGAVAGRFAAAGVELVDGAFEELANLEEVLNQALVIIEQLPEKLALAAGAFGWRAAP